MRRFNLLTGSLTAVLALTLFACSSDDDPVDDPDAGIGDVGEHNIGEPDADEPEPDADEPEPEPDADEPEPDATIPDHPEHRSADCDPLMEDYCTMPWPSNLYLEADDERHTGYTLDFGETTLPRSNRDSQHVDPAAYRQLDGYGLGTPVAVLFPGVDISEMPAEESIEDSVEVDDLHAFYFEVTDDGLEPVPFWAELDVHAESEEEQVLYLRPAVILEEDTRYIVGFRNLVDSDGNDIEASEAFERYRSGEAVYEEELAWRQERFDDIFDHLEAADVERDELTLAWDFHTGSSDGLHSDLLHIMDEGLQAAADEGIDITINNVNAHSESEHPHIAFEIQGTFRVPHFLEPSDRSGAMSYLFHRGDDGRPTINDWREADFWLQIPHSAVDGTPHGLVKYGHGMLGSGSQVSGSFNQKIANENNLIFYAADFVGFSSNDVMQALQALPQPTYFEELVDRMHQGVLEYALLTQAMLQGLEALPEDEMVEEELEDDASVTLTIDEDRIYYSGISQGGIYGVTALAVDPIIERGHFGVPGHNYAMLMERSTNFYGGSGGDPGYIDAMSLGYPDRIDQSMAIPIIQLLWDKIDPISYLRRLSHEPFDPDMPKHGLFGLAKADYQVAVVTKEITARSDIGIPLLENYDSERGQPWGVQTVEYDHEGSGIVNYDFGNPWPPAGNLPPDDALGDPHGLPRQLDEHNEQLVEFLDTGRIIDVCGGEPCYFPDAW